MPGNNTYREPLNSMSLSERCRYFAEFYKSIGSIGCDTNKETVMVFEEAANEIDTLNRILDFMDDDHK